MTGIFLKSQHAHGRLTLDFRNRGVLRAVIDKEDFVILTSQPGLELLLQRGNIFLLVIERNDDGYVWTHERQLERQGFIIVANEKADFTNEHPIF